MKTNMPSEPRASALIFDAEVAQTPNQIDKKATRKCLGCGEQFESDGFGNRICPRCKGSVAFKTGENSFEP